MVKDIKQPIGMSGVRLEVRVHIVTGAVSAAQNIVKCIKRCGVDVSQLILRLWLRQIPSYPRMKSNLVLL